MKPDFNLSMVSSVNSTHSLPSFNQSITHLAALFVIKDWINPVQGISVAGSIAQEKQQRLTAAFESYVLQPDAHRGHALMAQLQEAKADLTAEYDYAEKQQAFYTAHAEQEAQGGGSSVAAWTQWIWHGVQDFFGSSSKALAEKYAQIALSRRRQLEEVSSLLTTLQQARWEEWTIKADDENEEEIIAIDTSKIKASQRKLLQQQQSDRVSVSHSIPDQWINMNQLYSYYYSYPLSDVFLGNYSLLDAVVTGQSSLPGWLSLQYELLSQYPMGLYQANDVAVSGNTVFVTELNVGLLILDVSIPGTPRLIGNYSTDAEQAHGVVVSGSTIFIASGDAGLLILDVSTPSAPRLLGNYSTDSGEAWGVALSGSTVFVADGNRGLLILNASTPNTPRLLGSYPANQAYDVAVFDNTVFVAEQFTGVLIVDVSTPSAPQKLGSYSVLQVNGLAVVGSTVFVAAMFDGLLILDASTPNATRLMGSYSAPSSWAWANGVAVSGSTVFVADTSGGLLILDVSTLSAPRLMGSYSTGSNQAQSVTFSDGIVFVTDWASGLLIVDVTQGQLTGFAPNYPGQIAITVCARDFTIVLADTTFTLTLDRFPYILQTTVSDQSIFPGDTLLLHLSSSLFVNPSNSFLSLSIQSENNATLTGLLLTPSLIALSSFSVGFGEVLGVAISGSTVFVAKHTAGLLIVDVSTPSAPRLLGSYPAGLGVVNGVAVSGSTVFVADGNAGLLILDVSTPSTPRLLGNYSINGASTVTVSGSTLFVADGYAGLLILNVSNPSTPRLLCNYSEGSNTLAYVSGIAISGSIVFVADGAVGLLILEVSTPSTPQLLGNYSAGFGQVSGVAVSGSTVFVADLNVGLLILDVSTPTLPRLLGQYSTGSDWAYGVLASGNTVFVADWNAGLLIVDVSSPSTPRLLGSYFTGSDQAYGLAIFDSTVFLAGGSAGLQILDVSQWTLTVTPTMVDVGNYPLQLTATDALGGTASASFTLRVEGPPKFNGKIPSHYAKVGETFSYFAPLGLVTDPNFNPITFDSTLVNGQPLPHWLSFSPISATYAGTPQDEDIGNFTILLTATDNIAGVANTTFSLYVNHVPIVITSLPQSLTGRTGRFFAFQVPETTFSHWPDDPILFYNATLQDGSPLPVWLSFNGSTQNRTFLGTPVIGRDEGTINLIVQATDNWGEYVSAPMQLSLLSNSPPYVTSQIPDQPARIGNLFLFSLSQSEIPFLDINGDSLIYTADCPAWLKLEIENQSTTVAPPYWPQWLAYNSTSVNMLTFSGRPSFNDYSDALLFRTARVVIYAYDDFPSPQSRASVAFDIQVQGINQTGISLAVVSSSMMLVLAVYGAYKKWPILYNCFCKKRYSVNSVTAYIGESFEYKPTAVQPRIQAGEVEEVTVVLPAKTNCCRFFQPYRPLRRGLERPNWMEYDIQSDCLRTKRMMIDHKENKSSFLPVEKVDNEDQLIVQLRKENSQIVQQFTLFIDQRPSPLENDFKNSKGKQNDDDENMELAPLTEFVIPSTS